MSTPTTATPVRRYPLYERLGMKRAPYENTQAEHLLRTAESFARQDITILFDFQTPDLRAARARVIYFAREDGRPGRWLFASIPGASWFGRKLLVHRTPNLAGVGPGDRSEEMRRLDEVAVRAIELHYPTLQLAETARVTLAAHGFNNDLVPGHSYLDVAVRWAR